MRIGKHSINQYLYQTTHFSSEYRRSTNFQEYRRGVQEAAGVQEEYKKFQPKNPNVKPVGRGWGDRKRQTHIVIIFFKFLTIFFNSIIYSIIYSK